MRIKKLLVQFEYDERTRWLADHDQLADFVKPTMESVARCFTQGAVPAITVTEEENPQSYDNHDTATPAKAV
jgi:hypothetical protein